MARARAGRRSSLTEQDSPRDGAVVGRGPRVLLARTATAEPYLERLEVRRRADDALLGHIQISQIARGNFQSGYLGYAIGAEHRGRGYMTEALQLALRHAFRTLRLHRLEANVACRRVDCGELEHPLGFLGNRVAHLSAEKWQLS